MDIDVKVRFRTERPLTQEEASRIWLICNDFGAISPSTYLMTARAKNTTLMEAAQLLTSSLPQLFDFSVDVVGVDAQVVDARNETRPSRRQRTNREARAARRPAPTAV